MKTHFLNLLLLATSLFFSLSSQAQSSDAATRFVLAIHGGAGTILKANMSDSLERAYKEVLEDALRSGYQLWKKAGRPQMQWKQPFVCWKIRHCLTPLEALFFLMKGRMSWMLLS